MASLLSMIGLGNSPAPDPSTFTNQQIEAKNFASAKATLSDTTSTINLALNTAKLGGLDPTYTQALQSLNNEATTLSDANLNAAELSKRAANLDTKLSTLKVEQAEATRKQNISDMESATRKIQTRTFAIRADTTSSPDIIKKYNDLLLQGEGTLAQLQTQPIDISGSKVAPITVTADELLSKLDDLDGEKEAEEEKEFNWDRFRRKIFRSAMYWSLVVSLIFGALFGGIIMSNTYATEAFWGIKLYYFIYGALFFPISLLYGAVKAPFWVSGLLPIYQLKPVMSVAPIPKPEVASDPQTAESIVASLAQSAITKMVGGATAEEHPISKYIQTAKSILSPTDAAHKAKPAVVATRTIDVVKSTPTLAASLFGYLPVDTANPSPAQASSRTSLRVISIVEIVILSSFAIYYGVDKLILKNKESF